ncbi:MAG: hypothetical protein J6Y06_01815 [Bacteroidales bacterium]|nr:hypothetical protein [Bacteroidales bacterium]
MNKKIKNLFLAGALVLGFAGVAVSCTDYDKDINDLQQKISAQETKISTLETNVNSLQSAINAGAVITSVTPLSGETGGWKFTLSDGKSYDVTNGAAGAPGKDGKFYTPNAETGCWDLHEFVDGKEVVTDTKQKYLPENGATITYDAEKNVLVVKQGEETHEISLTATSEAGLVFLPQSYIDGVEGLEATSMFYNPLEIVLKNKKSTIDSKDEKWQIIQEPDIDPKTGKELKTTHDKEVQVPIAAQAQYHVNVSDFEFDDSFTYEFIYKDVEYIKTRTEASKDFSMTASFNNYADGILTVNVEVTGREAYAEDITRFALQVTKDGKSVTSDYATLLTSEMRNVRIADPKKISKECKDVEDEHYRRGTEGISAVDAEDLYIPDKAAWIEGLNTLPEAHATCDTAVAYDGTLDLKTITIPHFLRVQPGAEEDQEAEAECAEMKADDVEAAGLEFVYEVVLNYKIGKPVTPQDEFVTLTDGVFVPRTFETSGTAAIGRTPIIRVKLMHGEDIVQVAYIKVFIAERVNPNPEFELVPVRQDGNKDLPQGENIFRFFCDGDALMTTVKDMNELIYNPMQMSKDQFHLLYTNIKAMPAMKESDKSKENDLTLGTVEDVVVDPVEGTHVIKWTLEAGDLWEFSGEEVAVIARYYNKDNENIYVDVLLTATVADALKGVNLESAKGDYITEYWTPNFEATKYNVNVPALKDSADEAVNCQFENDINASFITYPRTDPNAGKLKVENVDSVYYYFCAPHIMGDKEKGIDPIAKIGKLNVSFRVSDAGDSLYATILNDKGEEVTEEELVANIVNEPTEKGDTKIWNMFKYVEGETVADTLLNTGEMYTFIGATAYLCTDNEEDMKEVAVTFDSNDHFRANILRPLTVSTKSKEGFIDAVDFGEKGSWVKIEDLIDPVDWRGRLFSKYTNYWGYYGPFEIVVDIATAECDLNGERQLVPQTIILTQVEAGATTLKDPVTGKEVQLSKADAKNINGYLTYKNNGTNVTKDFNIYVKAKVGYGFGWIDSDWITIPVAKTIGQ